ncbi:MAG: NADH:flavin oxidoreductase [Pseudomonadota bacterium]
MYEALFTPLRLKRLTLKNRIVSTAHAPAYAEDGKPKERYQRYHEEKAKGGLALTMFGGASAIAPDSPPSFGQIYVGSDDIVPYFQAFADRIHAQGAALMCQLSHVGRRTLANGGDWLPAISASARREPAHGSFPKAMERADFRRVAKAYGAAARRCEKGGLDGCELLVSGHLIGQFWSPLINDRSDAYGGRLENRLRFGLEILAEIRDRVSDDLIVGLRFTADEFVEGGLNLEESLEIAQRHAESGLVDFLNINGGCNWTNAGIAEAVPGMAFPGAPYLEISGRIRRAVDLPVFHAARIADLASANRAIEDGKADMVGMTRAHMADPHLVSKFRNGREAESRPCVGAGYCIDRIYRGGDALCLHNAATGRESAIPHSIEKSNGPRRKVVIVGAGPGGLEAARVASARGHEVILFEAASEAGGQVLLAAKAGWRRDLIGIVRWLVDRVESQGVAIRTNRFVEAEEVLAERPDLVIVATGGVPNMDLVPGGNLAVSTWDVLAGHCAPGARVLVYDDNGDHQAPSTAEVLAEAGAEVDFVTPGRRAGENLGTTNAVVHLRNLYRLAVALRPDRRLIAIEASGNDLKAVLENEYSAEREVRTYDQIVIECGTLPVDELYFALLEQSRNHGQYDLAAFGAGRLETCQVNPEGAFELYRIGDAVASRNIHAAIYDAIRLCKDL